MKKTLLYSSFTLLLLFFSYQINFAQSSANMADAATVFYAEEGSDNWLNVRAEIQISALDLARTYKTQLGLGPDDELVNYKTIQDDLGITHYRFQQYHKGVKVNGAKVLMHEKSGQVFLVNGRWARGLSTNISTRISEAEALANALEYCPAEKYMWESEAAEGMLKRVKNDTEATFYPQPEQVLVDPALDQNAQSYRVAYQMEIHTMEPAEEKKQIFVDANSGAIILELNMMHTQDTVGTAETKYNGTREIVADQNGDNFRLREAGRGGGIETYNMQNGTNQDDVIDFIDDDNYWNNVNANQDEAATDAHWGAEMTYDYFNNKFGYSGLNGANMPMICLVHYDENVVNAFWNGSWALFGDGNGNSHTALTSLDVVAHEFAHGVTQFNAGLIYQNESGALNESFSDIFGAAVEIWASPELGDWLIGEDFDLVNNGFRSMVNPKEDGDPDTYKGINWFTGNGDNGGVHTNSGVQNHWFYLLTEGGTGTNDRNDEFTVEGLGLDTAASIAFRNLRFYLTDRSQYEDARIGAIQAAEDLYGPCSEAVKETMKAWYAVGVGREKTDYDVELLGILSPDPVECGLATDGADLITIQLRYYGCNADLQEGDQIPLAFQVNNGAIFRDTLTLTATLTGGDTLTFSFNEFPVELTTSGIHSLKCWSEFDLDIVDENNQMEKIVDNVPDQNVDLEIVRLISPRSGCYLSDGLVEVEIAFRGCDFLSPGETVELFYNINGGETVSETINLPYLNRGGTVRHLMSQPVDLSNLGRNYINAWISYEPDYLVNNDTLTNVTVTNPHLIFKETVIDFEGEDSLLDSIYWLTEGESLVSISEAAARDGEFGIQMTGGDVARLFEEGEITTPDIDNVWNVNPAYNSRFCFCVDLQNQTMAQLSFDRRQTYSQWYSSEYNLDLQYASSMRLLIDETQIGPTFRPTNFDFPIWSSRTIDLEEYLGQQIEVCFEARALMNPLYDPIGAGDNTFLDNIVISGLTVATTEPLKEITGFEIFPNPGKDQFTLDFQSESALDLEINVLDAQGRLIQSMQRETITGQNLIPLDLPNLSPGMYLVQLKNQERHQVKKLVVK